MFRNKCFSSWWLSLGLLMCWTSMPLHARDFCDAEVRPESGSPYGELVLYPRLSLDNHTLDRIYHVSVSLAPALEVPPWRGAQLTGQVVLPVWSNDRGSEQRRVRVGVNTFRQEVVLGKRLVVRATVGMFTNHRAGIDLRAAYLLWRPDAISAALGTCLLTAETGYTGLFICDTRTRYFERWNRWSGAVGLDYYPYDKATRIELQHLYDLEGRQGWRADWTRRFRTVAVGFYALTVQRAYNVGFHLAIRFRSARPRGEARLRLRGPYYWDWQYTMKSKSYNPGYLQTYETTPDWNHADPLGRQFLLRGRADVERR
jgi:hypothetical protein